MDREQKAGPVDTTGPAREQTVNETTANSSTEAATASEPAGDDRGTASSQAASTDQAVPTEADAVLAGEVVAGEAPVDAAAAPATDEPEGKPLGFQAAELAALRSELAERTGDVQRISAEYANYRKRVERDRLAVAEQATAHVIASLLPVLDDLDRAREHGDLVGPFATMAEQLGTALAKFGLTGFGEVGDAFDPTRHEAVTHQTSAEVTAPTCVAVMRRGYLLGERLLRPALVAVADPESQ
jgi:molecular chaperone GrpE